MEVLTNTADLSEDWVRGFLLRLGYLLAAEYQAMPECELKDVVGRQAGELIDMADPDLSDEPPPLRAV